MASARNGRLPLYPNLLPPSTWARGFAAVYRSQWSQRLLIATRRQVAIQLVALPFHPDEASFNRANALYLAHASDVAYHRSPGRAAWDRLGLTAIPFRSKLNGTRGFLGVCDAYAVLAFRGTNPGSLRNWITDAGVRLVRRDHYHGRVHQGFSSMLRRSWRKVEAILHKAENKPLFITGHSLGGALAMLAGCRLARAGSLPAAIYTYGSPRVGDLAFCQNYAIPTFRIVNRLDLVPELPSNSVKKFLSREPRFGGEKIRETIKQLVSRVPSYGHVDTFVFIDRDGVITADADVEPWHAHAVARAIATRGASFLEGVTDHLIANYIRSLEGRVGRKQTGPRRRPTERERA